MRPDRPLGAGRGLYVVLASAMGIRLAVALLWSPDLSGDASDYVRLAGTLNEGLGLVDTNGNPSSWRPPLYPAFVAAVMGLTPGGGLWGVRVIQAVLSAASVLVLYDLARRCFDARTALVAAALLTVNIAHVAAVSRILSETLFLFLFLAGLRAVFVSLGVGEDGGRPSRPLAWAFAGGVGLGLGTLARGVLLPLPLLLGAGVLIAGRRRGRPDVRVRAPALATAIICGFVLVLAPWTIRNHAVHDRFVPVTTQVGATLYAGNHPKDGFVLGVMADDDRTRLAASMTEVEASGFLTRSTIRDWAREPGALPRLLALKLVYFLAPADWEILPWQGAFNPVYAFTTIWALFAAGVLLRETRTPEDVPQESAGRWIVWLSLAYFAVVTVVFYGSPRLRLPVEPLLAAVAAFGLTRALTGSRAAVGRAAVLGAGVAVAAVGLWWSPLKSVVKATLVAGGIG